MDTDTAQASSAGVKRTIDAKDSPASDRGKKRVKEREDLFTEEGRMSRPFGVEMNQPENEPILQRTLFLTFK